MNKLSIVLPIKETKERIDRLLPMHPYLNKYPKFVIEGFTLSQARRIGIDKVETKYTLCLDLDIILPDGYIEQALETLDKDPKIAIVAIDYESLQGHLAFGTSIWRTDILKNLYNWDSSHITHCECIHMWGRVLGKGYLIETLPYRAKHLKG